MEGTTVSVVLWEEDAQSGVIVELEEQRQKNFRSFEALRSAATVGEIRAADLAPWARSIVDSYLEDLAWDRQDDGDEVTTVSDDEPWDYGDVAELVMEAAPLPHDAMVAASWLGTDLLREHAAVGGASPGGNIDVYSVADTDAFLAAIEERGYTLRRHSGLMEEYWRAL
jgi:hypothetical protein